jgi:secreted trypsin-like serine protease
MLVESFDSLLCCRQPLNLHQQWEWENWIEGDTLMKIANILATVAVSTLLLSACGRETGYQTGDSDTGIRQGKTAEAGDIVSRSTVAVIAGRFEAICSGTVITKNVVLTAAHCIPEGLSISVVFAVNVTDTRSYRNAVEVVVHPQYIDSLKDPRTNGPQLNRNDIALVHFEGDLPAGYEPASILATSGALTKGTSTTVAGYGVYNDSPMTVAPGHVGSNLVGSGTGLLRSASVSILEPGFSQSEVVLDQTLGSGACQGDSGGPAYLKVGDRLHVWGVASWGRLRTPNGSCLALAVYTKIEPYKNWITSTISSFRR